MAAASTAVSAISHWCKNPDGSAARIEETLAALRFKDIRSTTLERMRVTARADDRVKGLSQPRQLGEGLFHLLDRIEVPVEPHDLLLGRILEEVPDKDGEVFFQAQLKKWNNRAIPLWMPDGGHECFDWERALRLGLPGLETMALEELEKRRAQGGKEVFLDFLEGAIRVLRAFRNYGRRYAKAAARAGLEGPAANCAAIAERAPQTFAEALQLIWLIGNVYCTMLAQNPTLTFGRMDELLQPHYEADLEAGRLTRELAGDLIEDFYCKNSLILGRGEHQMSGASEGATGWQRNLTYDAPQYVVLGGRARNGSIVDSDLTALFLERIVPRFENPFFVFRYCRETPDRIWRLVCEKMRANASFMVYSDENVIPAMIHSGIAAGDAATYTMHGCNWPDVPGSQRQVAIFQAELPRYVLEAILDEGSEISDINAVYEQVLAIFRDELGTHCERIRESRMGWEAAAPGPLRVDDCFLDGPIGRARSWQLGGVKYPTLTCTLWSPATAADSLAAIEELVFKSRKISLDALRNALRNNFEGQEPLRLLCKHAPKFGQDDDRADAHAVRLLEMLHREIDASARIGTEDGVTIFRCLETDMAHIRFGQVLGATPDGRHAGEPTSENTSPYPGSATRGLTALFRSMSKLPLHRIHSGALNVRLQPKFFKGEEGLLRLAALLRTYFDMGGLQVQLSCVSVDQLRDAQLHPELHRDLMVRITGYSAAFVDMARHAQDEIIRREEMGS